MAMRRGDRKSESDDNAINHPRSQRAEPISYHEQKQLLINERAKRDELQKLVAEKEQQAEQTHHLYLEEQQKYQKTLTLYQEVQGKYQTALVQSQEVQSQARSYLIQFEEAQTQARSYFTLHQEAQTQAQSYLTMYEAEKTRGNELTIKFEEVQGQRDRYLTLYNESQDQLSFERRSKAGIKGWETRRKRENERLKQEISEMTILLRDSLEHKDEAVNSLYVVAERMDRIQRLVDSVDGDTTTSPIGMVQKLQRIWQAVKEILAE
ncbi:MAG: hypothetical protein HC780_22390 [Leptolyngbyaceae cyanobacterium CSU_1_3]|nr:hypothetical protein [Leptolyngbyaceae cyanobacterium CSU_1_3]